jgi:hypothetical protein
VASSPAQAFAHSRVAICAARLSPVIRAGRSPSGSVARRIRSSDVHTIAGAWDPRSTARALSRRTADEPTSQTHAWTLPPRVDSSARRRPSGDQVGRQWPEPSSAPRVRFRGSPPATSTVQTSQRSQPDRGSCSREADVRRGLARTYASRRPSGESTGSRSSSRHSRSCGVSGRRVGNRSAIYAGALNRSASSAASP